MKKISIYMIGMIACALLIRVGGLPFGCGGSEANDRGVGSECASMEDCTEEGQECLPFKGGYCGVEDCVSDDDCPDGSFCVTHDDGFNYCFLICGDKPDCNDNRSVDNESNCSANVDFVESHPNTKACVPPSAEVSI